MTKQDFKVIVIGLVVVAAVVGILSGLLGSIKESEDRLGGSYEGCVELGHESAMCKRAFTW